MRIALPSRTTTASGRRPAYVSPSTASIVIVLGSVNGLPPTGPTTTEVDLTASNTADCSPPSALAPLTCTVSLTLPVGTDVLTLTTYDQTGGAGNVLSLNSVSASVVAGTVNTIPVTLAGVPAGVVTVPITGLTTTGTGAYTMGGASATLLVEPLDADANVIVGPGAPQLAITNVSPANVIAAFATATATNPNPNPNLVELRKLYGSSASAVVSFSATPPAGSGAGNGVSGTFSVLAPLEIYVASGSTVQLFIPPATTAVASTGTLGPVTQLGHDLNNREYLLESNQSTLFSYVGGTAFPTAGEGYSSGSSPIPVAFAVAPNGGMAFLQFYQDGAGLGMYYFPPDSTSVSQSATVDTAASGPVSAAFDPTSTTLYVATKNGIDEVTNVPTGPSVTQVSTSYISGQVAVGAGGAVYVDDGSTGVAAFSPLDFSTPVAFIPAQTSCGGSLTSSAFAVGGTTSVGDTLVVADGYGGCYVYQTFPSLASGSVPSVFANNAPHLAVTGGGAFVVGAGTTVSLYPALWGTASFTATAAGTITAIDAF